MLCVPCINHTPCQHRRCSKESIIDIDPDFPGVSVQGPARSFIAVQLMGGGEMGFDKNGI
jgi:hypothetical protein